MTEWTPAVGYQSWGALAQMVSVRGTTLLFLVANDGTLFLGAKGDCLWDGVHLKGTWRRRYRPSNHLLSSLSESSLVTVTVQLVPER